MAAGIVGQATTQTGANASHVGVSVVEVTGDASYPAGGYVLTNTQLGVPAGARVLGTTLQQRAAGFTPIWDTVANALRLYWTGAGLSAVLAEVGNGVSVTTSVTRVITFWEGL